VYADVVLSALVSENDNVSPSPISNTPGFLRLSLNRDTFCSPVYSMRPIYVVEKVFATFGVFSLIYTITEYYIMPYMPKPGESLLKSYMELAVPMIVNYLL
jgi:hypothetical protein